MTTHRCAIATARAVHPAFDRAFDRFPATRVWPLEFGPALGSRPVSSKPWAEQWPGAIGLRTRKSSKDPA
eukprot:11188989-Lingulodinium_polyedra.AAC.1